MISTRPLRPLAAAALAAGLIAGTNPTMASPNAATVTGGGTISPGLPDAGCAFQSVTFSGTAEVVGTHGGSYSVTFNGASSICETRASGAGGGVLGGDVNGTVSYSRTGPVVTLSGSVTIDNGEPHNIDAGGCVFAPTSVNPVQTYQLVCHLVLGLPQPPPL